MSAWIFQHHWCAQHCKFMQGKSFFLQFYSFQTLFAWNFQTMTCDLFWLVAFAANQNLFATATCTQLWIKWFATPTFCYTYRKVTSIFPKSVTVNLKSVCSHVYYAQWQNMSRNVSKRFEMFLICFISQLLKSAAFLFWILMVIIIVFYLNCFDQKPKLYIPSTLNTDYLLWYTQLIVCAIKY